MGPTSAKTDRGEAAKEIQALRDQGIPVDDDKTPTTTWVSCLPGAPGWLSWLSVCPPFRSQCQDPGIEPHVWAPCSARSLLLPLPPACSSPCLR
ncbi:unnamed protein product, partial [Gulo gulo]